MLSPYRHYASLVCDDNLYISNLVLAADKNYAIMLIQVAVVV